MGWLLTLAAARRQLAAFNDSRLSGSILTDQTLSYNSCLQADRVSMARPKSDERRSAILAAAVRVIDAQGLNAATATIAKEAGVSNGSLFTYFETKAELLNQLYIELKTEMAMVAMEGLPKDGDLRGQMLQMWCNWLHWASSYPDKRRTLAHLGVADEITSLSRTAGHQAMLGIAALIDRSRQSGPLREAPLRFVSALMSAVADTTMDFMIGDSARADMHCTAAFEAVWRMLT